MNQRWLPIIGTRINKRIEVLVKSSDISVAVDELNQYFGLNSAAACHRISSRPVRYATAKDASNRELKQHPQKILLEGSRG